MPKYYSAKYIMIGDGNLLEDSTIVVEEGKIQNIIKNSEFNKEDCKNLKDYGNAIITPGFVNLHNQLQYTNVGKIKPKKIKSVIKSFFMNIKKQYFLAGLDKNSFVYKIGDLLSQYFVLTREEKIKSFEDGLTQNLLSGTTAIVQLSKETKYFEVLNKYPIKTYLFFEVLSDSREKSKEEFRSIQKRIDKLLKNKSEDTFIGVAPHSVCSAHKRLYKILAKYCKKNNILMTTRLGESQAELDWLKHGFSDIDILNAFTGLKKFEPYESKNPVDYLKDLNVISKRLMISHGSFLKDDELETLKENGVSLAYCPISDNNTHGQHLDLDKVLKYFGDNFGFGTNCSPFNGTTSLLEELRFVNKGQLNAIEAIKYLTLIPAKILRLDNIIGSIQKGKDADMCVFKLNEDEDYNAILNKTNPDYVYIKGRRVVDNGAIRLKTK